MKSATQKALTEHMLKTNGRRLTKEYEGELGALGESSLMLFLSSIAKEQTQEAKKKAA